jgi:hypothetical protein
MATNYIYKQEDPNTGEKEGRVGMITIFNEDEMHRVPEGAVEVGDVPVEEDPDGAYFDAWRLQESGTVKIDVEAAKEVRMDFLKQRRERLLKHLDAAQFRHHCSKEQDKVDELEQQKNALRDFPDKINWSVIHNLNDVKHILPPCLI